MLKTHGGLNTAKLAKKTLVVVVLAANLLFRPWVAVMTFSINEMSLWSESELDAIQYVLPSLASSNAGRIRELEKRIGESQTRLVGGI